MTELWQLSQAESLEEWESGLWKLLGLSVLLCKKPHASPCRSLLFLKAPGVRAASLNVVPYRDKSPGGWLYIGTKSHILKPSALKVNGCLCRWCEQHDQQVAHSRWPFCPLHPTVGKAKLQSLFWNWGFSQLGKM